MNLDPTIVRQQLANLERVFPNDGDEEAWAISIESETDTMEFLRRVERRRQEAEHMAGGIASNIAELEERQQRFERREQSMRSLAFRIMELAGLKRLEMPEATYSVRNGQQKLLGDVKPEDLSPEYTRVKLEINRAFIKDQLKAGRAVPGFELSNAEPVLSIRTK